MKHFGTLFLGAGKSVLGISPLDVGDIVLTFGRNKEERYMHAFRVRELARLLSENGFRVESINVIARESGEKNIVAVAQKPLDSVV